MTEAMLLFFMKEFNDSKIPVQYVLLITYRGNIPFLNKGAERLR